MDTSDEVANKGRYSAESRSYWDKWAQVVKTSSGLACSDQEKMEFRILKGGNIIEKKQDYNHGFHENRLWSLWGPALRNPMGDDPGEKHELGEGCLFQAQNSSINTFRLSKTDGRRPA